MTLAKVKEQDSAQYPLHQRLAVTIIDATL